MKADSVANRGGDLPRLSNQHIVFVESRSMKVNEVYTEVIERIYDTKNNIHFVLPRTCAVCTSYETALETIDDLILDSIKEIIQMDKDDDTYTDVQLYIHRIRNSLGEIPDAQIESVELVTHIHRYYSGNVYEFRLGTASSVKILDNKILIFLYWYNIIKM